MSRAKKLVVKRIYANWSGFLKCKKNSKKYIEAYFLGAWSAFDDDQAAMFIQLTTRKEKRVLMKYPIWM